MGDKKKGFFSRLVEGLTKTRDSIVSGIDSTYHQPLYRRFETDL